MQRVAGNKGLEILEAVDVAFGNIACAWGCYH